MAVRVVDAERDTSDSYVSMQMYLLVHTLNSEWASIICHTLGHMVKNIPFFKKN